MPLGKRRWYFLARLRGLGGVWLCCNVACLRQVVGRVGVIYLGSYYLFPFIPPSWCTTSNRCLLWQRSCCACWCLYFSWCLSDCVLGFVYRCFVVSRSMYYSCPRPPWYSVCRARRDMLDWVGMRSVQYIQCRSEEHTSELSHTVISYAVFCLKKKKKKTTKKQQQKNKNNKKKKKTNKCSE